MRIQNALREVRRVLGATLSPKPRAERVDMSGRRVLVTGVSPSSIGYSVAKTLACWGARVVGTNPCATQAIEKALAEELAHSGIDPSMLKVRPLDLCDVESVREFVDWYSKDSGGELHVLINNAGIFRDITMHCRQPLLAPDGEEIHWRTNFLGTFHLTHLLLPMLTRSGRENGDARVVFLASDTHERVDNSQLFDFPQGRYRSWDAYGRSKLAIIHFSKEIQRRYAHSCYLQSVSLHPGTVYTRLVPLALQDHPRLKRFTRFVEPVLALCFLTREQGAQTPIFCATQVPLAGGQYYERCRVSSASKATENVEVSKRLWNYAERWASNLAVPPQSTSRDFHL